MTQIERRSGTEGVLLVELAQCTGMEGDPDLPGRSG